MSRLYVVGDKETGILLIMIDPLRAALIPRDAIQSYANTNNLEFEVVFGMVAAAVQTLIVHSDQIDVPANVPEVPEAIGHIIRRGSTITDAEFCFISDVDSSDWGDFRNNCIPIEDAISALVDNTGKLKGSVPKTKLAGSRRKMRRNSKAKKE